LDATIKNFQTIKDIYKDSLINISLTGSTFIKYYDKNAKNLKLFIGTNDTEFNRTSIYDN